MIATTNPKAAEFLTHCDQLYTATQVQQAIANLAEKITADLVDKDPILLCVMNGGLVFSGQLLPLLGFPLSLDYLHATRYQKAEHGAKVQWLNKPNASLTGRCVLILDDILDEGLTLRSVLDFCSQQGASEVKVAVMIEKQHQRNISGIKSDYIGLSVVDRYIFGMGMDYQGYWRNAPGIYAVKF
jgi:hypoxanthine phosphoribosyltransferase|tara:strand:- start:1098 stop:1652 length:555 start_codon:yes stop_codon:yes gene_type:complete